MGPHLNYRREQGICYILPKGYERGDGVKICGRPSNKWMCKVFCYEGGQKFSINVLRNKLETIISITLEI